jgi:hypothetical protein
MSQKELLKLYNKLNIEILDKEYHDVLTAIKFNKKSNSSLKKSWISKIFKNEIALLGIN